tara:strand:- start:59 stop:283 length:225 start_codon:yes stop_codon:yes gene_type:complete
MSNENWSSESQAMTRICVLESQLDVKGTKIGSLETQIIKLKLEVDRLQTLVNTITSKEQTDSTMDILNRLDNFK